MFIFNNAYIYLVADDFLLNHHYTINFDRKLTYKGDLHERHLTKQKSEASGNA